MSAKLLKSGVLMTKERFKLSVIYNPDSKKCDFDITGNVLDPTVFKTVSTASIVILFKSLLSLLEKDEAITPAERGKLLARLWHSFVEQSYSGLVSVCLKSNPVLLHAFSSELAAISQRDVDIAKLMMFYGNETEN